jgi:hypothetical protein
MDFARTVALPELLASAAVTSSVILFRLQNIREKTYLYGSFCIYGGLTVD